MVFLDDLKDLVLYKKPFVLPINEKNIKKGSAIYLISPNLSTSTKIMNAPYLVNKMSIYQSYYLEKNANYYINKEGFLQDVDDADEFLCEVGEDDVLLAPAKKLEDEEVQNMELYFLSDKYMDGVKLEPRVPDNELTRNGYEDNTTPRTPFCTTIEGCLASFGENVSGKQFYVYQPEEEELEVWEPNERACPDAKVTGEKWVLKQVQLKCIGKIKCLSTEENTTSVYTYGNQHSNSFNWNFKWVEKEGVPVQESVGPLEEKLFQDFRDYIKGKRKFENVQPLSSPIIHEANKKKETWLLLATYYGEFNKKNTSQFLTELQKNVKYDGVEVEFHTCYLPGDIFIFAKMPKDSMSESAIFNEANSRDQQKYQSNFKKKKTDKKFKYLSIKSPEAQQYLEKDKFCKSISKSFKDYNGEIVVEGDNVVGYVFVGDKVDKGFIHSLRVYPPYRGCGVGGKLLDIAITKYGGYDLTVDKDNELAIDIYKRKGFAIDDSRNAGKKMHYMVLKSHKNESAVNEKYSYFDSGKFKKVPKNVKLYHGSRTQNLEEITPKNESISRIGNASAVYASKDKRFAACYGTEWRDDIAKQGSWDNWNTVVMGISDKVNMDSPCSLYELENDGSFVEISTKEVVSTNTIKVIKEHKYSSYKDMLMQNGVKMISYDNYMSNINNPNPKFNYLNQESVVQEEATAGFTAFLFAMFGATIAMQIKDEFDKKKGNTVYYVASKAGGRPVTSKFQMPEGAISHYAYIKNIHEGENRCIYVDDSNRKALNDTIYLYKENNFGNKLVKSGTLESVCKSYNMGVKEIDKSISKGREDAFDKAISLLKSKLPGNIKSKGKFYGKSEELYKDFVNGISSQASLFYASLWDIDKEARTHEREGANNSTIWEPLNKCIANVSKELPKGYKISSNGDWDDILLDIEATGSKSVKESFGIMHESKNREEYNSSHKRKSQNGNFKFFDIQGNKNEFEYYAKDDIGSKKNSKFIYDNYVGEILVDMDKEKFAGYVLVKKDGKDKGFIQPLWLFEGYRGYGFGTKLLKDAVNKYNAVGLTVDVDNKVAIEMYKKNGFVIVGYGNKKNNSDYCMKLKSKLSEGDKPFDESVVQETTRSKLPESEFGVPSKRKFPLDSAQHVKSAIRFFNYVEPEDEVELAKRIKKKAKEFGVPIRCGKKNRLSKYISKKYVNEFMAASAIGNDAYAVINGSIKQAAYQNGFQYTEDDEYPYTKKKKAKIHKNNMMKNDFTEE